MADCQKHFFCVPASDYKPVKAATLALASLIFMVASGAVGFTPGGIVGGRCGSRRCSTCATTYMEAS